MPSYAGGKAKIGREIAETIERLCRIFDIKPNKIYIPFAGFLGVSRHLVEYGFKIRANDANNDIISMWKMLKKGEWSLPNKPISRAKYERMKRNEEGEPHERGFFGVACAYSGIPFAGYRIRSPSQNFFEGTRNGVNEIVSDGILNYITFTCSDYATFLKDCKNTVIYADPPYEDNNFGTQYFKDFDSQRFWNIMRKLSKHNLVIISEYQAPDDFICVWEKQYSNVFSSKVKQVSEKLFIYEGKVSELNRNSHISDR